MAHLEQKSLLDLPDEVIEEIMNFLLFSELFNLSKVDKRLKDCEKRVSKKKPFKVAIIGGYNGAVLDAAEVMVLVKDSISLTDAATASLPTGLQGLGGTQLPNNDMLLSGGWTGSARSDEYQIYKNGFNQWKKVGTMRKARYYHSSVMIDGYLFTAGGRDSSWLTSSHLEEFSFLGGVKEKKEMPVSLYSHSATILDKNKMLICGGLDTKDRLSQRTFVYNINENSWSEWLSLLTPRARHCSCAILADNGSTQFIIIIGGVTDQEDCSRSTEILDSRELLGNISIRKWVPGPSLPIGIKNSACVALPPSFNFSCVVIGGETNAEYHQYLSNVYGLNKSLTEWTLLGKIKTGRRDHIALSFS